MLGTEPETGEGASNGESAGPEAPQLAQLVEDGELPPVEERLPANPMVLPTEEIGRYGGDLRMLAFEGGVAVNETIGYENLVRFEPGMTEDLTIEHVIPNVAEEWEVGADGAEYTFKLREGMKWSDGEPFTADDIVFWYEATVLNTELSPVYPDWLDVGEGAAAIGPRIGGGPPIWQPASATTSAARAAARNLPASIMPIFLFSVRLVFQSPVFWAKARSR
jgi:peptide/nickel transport system substrate-binding protein